MHHNFNCIDNLRHFLITSVDSTWFEVHLKIFSSQSNEYIWNGIKSKGTQGQIDPECSLRVKTDGNSRVQKVLYGEKIDCGLKWTAAWKIRATCVLGPFLGALLYPSSNQWRAGHVKGRKTTSGIGGVSVDHFFFICLYSNSVQPTEFSMLFKMSSMNPRIRIIVVTQRVLEISIIGKLLINKFKIIS